LKTAANFTLYATEEFSPFLLQRYM